MAAPVRGDHLRTAAPAPPHRRTAALPHCRTAENAAHPALAWGHTLYTMVRVGTLRPASPDGWIRRGARIRLRKVEPFDPKDVRAAYDTVAEDYVAAFADEFDRLPVDRSILDASAELLSGAHPVLDMGCGPGQVAHYLTARGIRVIGLDLAPLMLLLAAHRTNGSSFACGDIRVLPFTSQSGSAVVASYSIQHLPRSVLPIVLDEIRRILTSEGILVIATHLGEGEIYVHEFVGHDIEPMGGTLYSDEELRDELLRKSFSVEQSRQRDPLPHEHQSKRIYVIARNDEK